MARILIVNDEVDLLRLCQDVLHDAGHEVEIVTGGKRALELACHGRPDLIIVDWVMPDMDGSALVARLKGIPETKGIPLLAMSALRDGATRAALAGTNHFLPKPFGIDQLVEAVDRTLAPDRTASSGRPTQGKQ